MAATNEEAWLFCGRNALYFLPLVLIFSYLALAAKRNYNSKYPPCYCGWIPWLGCALEFGKAPLHFIDAARRKLGPVFTLKVAGKRMTFVTEQEDFKYFFLSEDVDFQRAVQVPVQNTANIPAESFYRNHKKIHDTVKWKLAPNLLKPFYSSLTKTFIQSLSEWENSGCRDLNQMVRSSMYKSVMDELFGTQVLPTQPQETFEILEKHFVKFDAEFEYGAQLPEIFLRDWSQSKQWLLKLFKDTVQKVQARMNQTESEEQTLLHSIIGNIEGSTKHNFALLMLWASLANAIPITFWTLAFIISHPTIYKELKKEVDSVLGKKGKDLASLEITEEDLMKMPGVKRAILEAIRLRSPGVITRMVTKEFSIRDITVPAGDMLMLSPYWAHRNPAFFPCPEEFNPDRWLQADIDKNLLLDGFIAFGGGRYQCPGRWFALLEMHLYVALAIHMFSFKLEGDVPALSPLHVVGTQQPVGPCMIEYTRLDRK